MFDNIYLFYTKEFVKLNLEGKDGFTIIRSSVAIKLLNHAYKLLLDGNEIIEIENLEIEKISFYWNISKRYYDEQNKCIEASKATYVLSWLTKTEI
jgi:hypothetical protein